jgi:hypothetical protein
MRNTRSKPTSTARQLVVGVADHNGWMILVSVAAVDGHPVVVDRRRVELIEKGVPSQPYHHETLALRDVESERLLRQVRQSIAACTSRAFDRLAADLSPAYHVTAITIRHPPLEELPSTVADVHASYYVQCRADGMLYHSAICAAARERGWPVTLHHRGEELALAAKALRASPEDVEQFITDQKRTLKAPWTTEYRHAFAAAIGCLTDRVRMPTQS